MAKTSKETEKATSEKVKAKSDRRAMILGDPNLSALAADLGRLSFQQMSAFAEEIRERIAEEGRGAPAIAFALSGWATERISVDNPIE